MACSVSAVASRAAAWPASGAAEREGARPNQRDQGGVNSARREAAPFRGVGGGRVIEPGRLMRGGQDMGIGVTPIRFMRAAAEMAASCRVRICWGSWASLAEQGFAGDGQRCRRASTPRAEVAMVPAMPERAAARVSLRAPSAAWVLARAGSGAVAAEGGARGGTTTGFGARNRACHAQ